MFGSADDAALLGLALDGEDLLVVLDDTARGGVLDVAELPSSVRVAACPLSPPGQRDLVVSGVAVDDEDALGVAEDPARGLAGSAGLKT